MNVGEPYHWRGANWHLVGWHENGRGTVVHLRRMQDGLVVERPLDREGFEPLTRPDWYTGPDSHRPPSGVVRRPRRSLTRSALTREDAAKIGRRRAQGETLTSLARAFDVDPSTVHRILAGEAKWASEDQVGVETDLEQHAGGQIGRVVGRSAVHRGGQSQSGGSSRASLRSSLTSPGFTIATATMHPSRAMARMVSVNIG